MKKNVVYALKGLIAFFAAIILVTALWALPWIANENAQDYPEFAHLRIPLLLLAEFAMLCLLSFLICIWALLTRVREGRIFSTSSITWVKALTLIPLGPAVACAKAMPFTPGPPLLILAEILAALTCLAISLLLLIMKGLLEQASSLRTELDEVI